MFRSGCGQLNRIGDSRSTGLVLLLRIQKRGYYGGEGEIHSSEWFGQPVAIDVTLFEGEEMEQYARQAGLCDVEVVERPPYAFEYQSRRLYLSARVIPRFLS